jgi:hypothetical protein
MTVYVLEKRRSTVYVSMGPGGVVVDDWADLFAHILRVIVWASCVWNAETSCCRCGCRIQDCDYCASECAVDGL